MHAIVDDKDREAHGPTVTGLEYRRARGQEGAALQAKSEEVRGGKSERLYFSDVPKTQAVTFCESSISEKSLVLAGLGSLALALPDRAATNIDVQLAIVVEPPSVREQMINDPLRVAIRLTVCHRHALEAYLNWSVSVVGC